MSTIVNIKIGGRVRPGGAAQPGPRGGPFKPGLGLSGHEADRYRYQPPRFRPRLSRHAVKHDHSHAPTQNSCAEIKPS